MHFIN